MIKVLSTLALIAASLHGSTIKVSALLAPCFFVSESNNKVNQLFGTLGSIDNRVFVESSTPFTNGWKVNCKVDLAYGIYNSSYNSPGHIGKRFVFDPREFKMILESQKLGSFTFGKTETACETCDYLDLHLQDLVHPAVFSGLNIEGTYENSPYSISVSRVFFGIIGPPRSIGARYDTPQFHGVSLRVGTHNTPGNNWDPDNKEVKVVPAIGIFGSQSFSNSGKILFAAGLTKTHSGMAGYDFSGTNTGATISFVLPCNIGGTAHVAKMFYTNKPKVCESEPLYLSGRGTIWLQRSSHKHTAISLDYAKAQNMHFDSNHPEWHGKTTSIGATASTSFIDRKLDIFISIHRFKFEFAKQEGETYPELQPTTLFTVGMQLFL